MANQTQFETNTDFWHRFSMTLEGLAHGAFVELPAKFAGVVDWGTRHVNQIPRLWDGTKFTENPLQYEESVRNGAQKIYDTVNGWTGYEQPDPVDDLDHILYGAGEFAGQFVLPAAGAYTKGAGLITSAPKLSSVAGGVFGTAKWAGLGVLKHFKLPALGVTADGYFNDFGWTKWGFGQATSATADKLREVNDAPDTGGKIYNEVHPPEKEEDSDRGPRTDADPVVGDYYNSWVDSIEKISGFDVPDVIEEYADGGLSKFANSSFGNWLAGGSAGVRWSLGATSFLASNVLLDKVIGNSLMSGALSLGFAAVSALTVPNMVKDFAKADAGQTGNDGKKAAEPQPGYSARPAPVPV